MQKKVNRFLIFFIIITNFFWIDFPFCNAQSSRQSFMLWCDVGYSSFFTKWDLFKNTGNIGSGIGLGYNITAWNHFIFSIGVEYISLNSSIRPKNFLIYKNLIDTEGDKYIMEYKLQKFAQFDKTHNIFVPVFFGYKTDLKKVDFFVLAGGKIGYMFAANYTSKVTSFRTIGIYDQYIDPFEDMPNHYFDTKKYVKTGDLNLNRLQAVVSFELGVEIPSVIAKNAMRVSFFADYGVLNRQTSEMQKQKNDLIIFETIPNNIHLNSLYETHYKKSLNTNSFFTGLKVTLLLDVTKSSCPSCFPKNKSNTKRKNKY